MIYFILYLYQCYYFIFIRKLLFKLIIILKYNNFHFILFKYLYFVFKKYLWTAKYIDLWFWQKLSIKDTFLWIFYIYIYFLKLVKDGGLLFPHIELAPKSEIFKNILKRGGKSKWKRWKINTSYQIWYWVEYCSMID